MSQEEAKGESDPKEEKPQVGQMKKGDYMIHVFIEICRQIKVEEGGTVDPIIQLECMNEKKFTSAKDDIGASGVVIWNEHIFFEPRNVSVEQIEQAKVSIKLMNKKSIFKDVMIGMYEFDISYIYFMEQHLLLHKWIALSDPGSENFNEVTGYLKLSISVAASGDEQVQITEDSAGGDDSVMMPPAIRPEFFQLRFRFFKGEKLPIMDKALFGGGGSIDAYVVCNYMNKKLKTKTVKMANDIVFWYQEFLLPVQMPIMSSRLVMKLYDEDKLNDEIVGTMVFNLKDYINQKAQEPTSIFFWKNIYGSPLGVSGKNTDLMNSTPDLASTWKGRILMEVVAEKSEKPLLKVEDIEDDMIKELGNPYMVPHEYEIMAEVGQGIALPEALKYQVKIRIADQEFRTEKPVFAENTYNRWNQRFQKTTWSVAYQDIYDIGKVYIYLMDGDKAICYAKDDIENFINPNAKYQWYEMTPDLSIGKVKEPHKAGFISIKLSIHDKTNNGSIDFSQYPAWKKPPPKRPINFKIRAYVYQCRDLPAADSDGQSDPYIVFWDQGKEKKQTKVIEDNVNPLFYEVIELSYEANSLQDMPPFVLDVYDKDFNPLDSDDFICRALIPLNESHYSEDDTVLKPKWHNCRLKKGAPESGDVLISFSVVPDDFSFQTPLNYMNLMETVDFDEYQVEISILGLRGLQSVGILPVKKAFIQFSLKSLVPPNCARNIENIKTQPGPAGADPTINTMIKFTIPLPNDPLYCPRLQCSVFDNIFKSFMQPLLGVFTIPIGEIMFKKQKERDDAEMGLRLIISELDKIIQDVGIITYNVPEQKIIIDEDLDFKKAALKEKEEVQQIIEQKFAAEEKKVEKEQKKPEVKKEEVKQIKQAKDTLFEPLLLNLSSIEDDDDEYERRSSRRDSHKVSHHSAHTTPQRTPRRTPKSIIEDAMSKRSQLSQKSGGKSVKSMKSNKSGAQSSRSNQSIRDPETRKNQSFLNNSLTYFNKQKDVNNEELLKEYKEELDRSRREEEQEREISIMDMKRKGKDPNEVIKFPQYRLDELLGVYREVDHPPANLYIGLGWDEVPEDNRKHYRKFWTDELENVKELMPVPTPFDQYNLKRGQSRGASKGFFSFSSPAADDDAGPSTEQIVGKFKCIIDIEGEKEKQRHKETKEQLIHDLKTKLNQLSLQKLKKPLKFDLEQLDSYEEKMKFKSTLDKMGLEHLNIPNFISDMEASNKLRRLLLGQNSAIVRLYMISAYDLAAKDNDSPSDPYLYITLGDKVFNEREFYQLDNANPDFHKLFEFNAVFPGCPLLTIKVFDYDELFGDDLIGETSIDLEDRYFSSDWQQIIDKPVEYRQIYHPSSTISQGVCKLWVEVLPANLSAEDNVIWQIQPRPVEEFEVRVCIFDTLDIKMMDDEGTSDAYVRGFFDSKEETKETDTHFRCQDGKASFNYRFLFTTKNIRKDYHLNIQCYDKDLFSSNDIIGEAKINLKQAFEDVTLSKRPISICKQYHELVLSKHGMGPLEFKDDSTFWLQLQTRDQKGEIEKTGKVRIQVDILPKEYADQNKVGEARQEPNCNPFLPPPIGRISFSLNPLKMFQQLVGPALRRKIYCYCCLAACIAMCVMVAPIMLSSLMTKILLLPFS